METNIKNYEIKGLIDGIGHDCGGFKCGLYHNSKKIATVNDTGYGGCYEYNFNTDELEKDFEKFIDSEKVLREKDWTPVSDLDIQLGFSFDNDSFIYELIELFDVIRGWKKNL